MFIQSLILAVAKAKFTFQVESSGDDIVITVMPSTTAPECEGAIAQAHAALAVPLRVIVKNNDAVDQSIIADIQSYMQQRTSLVSNLDVVTKAVASASRAVKQEGKEKETETSTDAKKNDDKPPTVELESNKSRSLDL